MGILLVAAFATLVGFGLLFLIGKTQPISPAAPENLLRADLTESAWVRRYGVEGLQRPLVMLFTEMGFAPERCERGGSTVDLFANDPTPIKGGRIYVHGVLGGFSPVDGDEVRQLIATARPEFVGTGSPPLRPPPAPSSWGRGSTFRSGASPPPPATPRAVRPSISSTAMSWGK